MCEPPSLVRLHWQAAGPATPCMKAPEVRAPGISEGTGRQADCRPRSVLCDGIAWSPRPDVKMADGETGWLLTTPGRGCRDGGGVAGNAGGDTPVLDEVRRAEAAGSTGTHAVGQTGVPGGVQGGAPVEPWPKSCVGVDPWDASPCLQDLGDGKLSS